jgi:hypothetical protein
VKVSDSENSHFRNIHCYGNSKICGAAPHAHTEAAAPVLAPGAKVEKLAGILQCPRRRSGAGRDRWSVQVAIVKPEPASVRTGVTPVLAVSDSRLTLPECPPRHQYVSTDGTVLIGSFGLAPAVPGKPYYLTDESELRTYAATVASNGKVTGVTVRRARRRGMATDSQGNVYLAAVYAYKAS